MWPQPVLKIWAVCRAFISWCRFIWSAQGFFLTLLPRLRSSSAPAACCRWRCRRARMWSPPQEWVRGRWRSPTSPTDSDDSDFRWNKRWRKVEMNWTLTSKHVRISYGGGWRFWYLRGTKKRRYLCRYPINSLKWLGYNKSKYKYHKATNSRNVSIILRFINNDHSYKWRE